MPTILEGLGSERLVDEVFLVMVEQFNDALAQQQARGDQLDQERAARLGITLPTITLEPVNANPNVGFPYGNFHVGSIPSFIQTDDRVVNYPCLVVMPGRTTPSAEDARMDHYSVFSNLLVFHSFAKASPDEGTEFAYRRAQRMAEAVHMVVNGDPHIRRIVQGVSGPTLVERSEPWLFPSEDGHGDDWSWVAVMTQYQVNNYSMAP
jgi:hypothetical protein